MSKQGSFSRDFWLLLTALGITNVGSAITWTGLPVYVAEVSGNMDHMAGLFICETIASILITVYGGYLADRASRKFISIVTSVLCGGFMLVLLAALSPERIWMFYVIGILNALVGAVGSVAQSAWFNNLAMEEGLVEGLGYRGIVLSGVKLIGMGTGPLLFALFQQTTLVIDAISFFGAGVCLLFATNTSVRKKSGQTPFGVLSEMFVGFGKVFTDSRYRVLLLISSLSGLLSFPVINASVYTLKSAFDSPSYVISVFWVVGSVGSLISNLLLSRKVFHRFKYYTVFVIANLLMAVGFISMSFAQNAVWFIGSFALFTLSNPIINNLVIAELFKRADQDGQGRITSAEYTVTDVASMIGLLLFTGNSTKLVLPLLFLVTVPFIVLRSVIASKALNSASFQSSSE